MRLVTGKLFAFLTITIFLWQASWVRAQNFQTLHHFAGGTNGTGPKGNLAVAGESIFGTASGLFTAGGAETIFSLRRDGTRFGVLHVLPYDPPTEGIGPNGGLVLAGGRLYGTASSGGNSFSGTLFSLATNGTGFTVLHHFSAVSATAPQTNSDGSSPLGGLIVSGDKLYGTAAFGGAAGGGTVFVASPNGSTFDVPRHFFHSNGIVPYSELLLAGTTLYGTAGQGSSNSSGTVFSMNLGGTGFALLHVFSALSGPSPRVNSDGSMPTTGLVLAGGTLYGTTSAGGPGGGGTVFAVKTNGSGFTVLHGFSNGPDLPNINADGTYPSGGLTLLGDTLYGTAIEGGAFGDGTIFCVRTNGTAFRTVHDFLRTSNGAGPTSKLLLLDNELYGTTREGGTSGFGTAFKFSLGSLSIVKSATNLVLSWPPSGGTLVLQSASALTGTFTNVPEATSPFSIPISGDRRFFRLNPD